jgi:hypothetical protein
MHSKCVSDSFKTEGVLQGLKKSDNINEGYDEE